MEVVTGGSTKVRVSEVPSRITAAVDKGSSQRLRLDLAIPAACSNISRSN
jgi:hypothetical protein